MVETHKARVDGVDSLVGACIDISTLIGDHEGTSLANDDYWWTYFYFDGHVLVSPHS